MKLFTPILAFLLAPVAAGQAVYVVDDDGGPGVDFLEIDDALVAAGPRDRIEVRAGFYREVLVADAATVMGEDGVVVDAIRVVGLPAGQRVVLADIAGDLDVEDCDGTVVVDNERISWTSAGRVTVTRSRDVWLREITIRQFTFTPLEIEDSTVFADNVEAFGSLFVPYGHSGREGAIVRGDSVLVAAHSTFFGEAGGCAPSLAYIPGYGGPGLSVGGTSHVVLIESDAIGGVGDFAPGCLQSGIWGRSLVVGAGATVISNDDISNPFVNPSGSFSVEPNLPTLEVTQSAASPGLAEFALAAPAGTFVRNFMGRFTEQAPFGPASILRAHNFSFGQFVGVAPAAGSLTTGLAIPAGRRGAVFYAQGAATAAGGRTDLSNPVALVVR